MGDYITKKSDMKFQSQEALKSVSQLLMMLMPHYMISQEE